MMIGGGAAAAEGGGGEERRGASLCGRRVSNGDRQMGNGRRRRCAAGKGADSREGERGNNTS